MHVQSYSYVCLPQLATPGVCSAKQFDYICALIIQPILIIKRLPFRNLYYFRSISFRFAEQTLYSTVKVHQSVCSRLLQFRCYYNNKGSEQATISLSIYYLFEYEVICKTGTESCLRPFSFASSINTNRFTKQASKELIIQRSIPLNSVIENCVCKLYTIQVRKK